MKITSISYSRKVSDMNYGNHELGLIAEVQEGETVADAIQLLKDCVDLKLGLVVLPKDSERKFVEKLAAIAVELESGNIRATSFTRDDADKARSIINRVEHLREALKFLGEDDYDFMNWEEYSKERTLAWRAYFPDSPEAK